MIDFTKTLTFLLLAVTSCLICANALFGFDEIIDQINILFTNRCSRKNVLSAEPTSSKGD